MRKHFLLFLLMALLLPLSAWAQEQDQQEPGFAGNIGVQLSTTMTKEFGTPDPEYLAPTDFVIISNTTEITPLDEENLENVLKFKRKQDNEGEDRGTYDYEVTVDAEWAEAHPGVTVVATNTGRITITEKALTDDMIVVIGDPGKIEGDPFTFKAAAWEPKPDVMNGETQLVENTDFTYSWEDNVNAGTGKVIITAVAGGNYSGTAEKTFVINPKPIDAADLSIDFDDEYTYTGAAIEPEVTVKDLGLGASGTQLVATDFSVAYTGNTNATLNEGETYLTVSAKDGGNYTFDAVNKNFTINKHALTIAIKAGQKKVFGDADPVAFDVEYGTGDNGFVGEETAAGLAALETPQFVVPTLARVAGENAGVYAISITNADAVVEGARNYDVTIAEGTVNFSIQAKDITEAITITLTNKEGDDYIYNGNEHFKNVAVTLGETPLTENVHYTVATTDNVNAGTATVTVTGMNNYKGTKTATFDIEKAAITIVPEAKTKAYGVAQDPDLTYTLKVGETTLEENPLNGTVKLQRQEGETVGVYNIWFKEYDATEAQLAADNYTIANTDVMADEVEAARYALFTITGSEQTLYLKFKEGTIDTKEYGDPNPAWSIADLEVDTSVEGGAECDNWEDIMYSFGDPVFAIASENVEDNETNEVTVTNQLTSPIYPTVVVASMPFTITAKDIALVVADQEIAYGDALNQEAFALADDYALAGEETVAVLNVTIKVDNLGTYGPGYVAKEVIYATIDNDNYNLVTDDCTWGDLTVTEAQGVVDLALDDSKDDNLIKINAHDGLDANVTIKFSQRDATNFFGYGTWKAGFWTTLVLPFDISVADLSKAFGYAIVNVIDPSKTKVNGTSSEFYGKLTMKGGNGKEEVLAANKPILIKIADDLAVLNDETYVVDFGKQTIVAPEDLTMDAGEGAKFVGTYEAMTIGKETDFNDGSIWFMLGDYAEWAFINANSSSASWTIVPFAAYIDMNAIPKEARNMTFNFQEIDGSITAVKSIDTDNLNSKLGVEGWYTINGMKLDAAPTQKGIYINNGKKVIIK